MDWWANIEVVQKESGSQEDCLHVVEMENRTNKERYKIVKKEKRIVIQQQT